MKFIPNPSQPGGRILVTDRALRYRAQANPPPGPRVCHYCGSSRHVEVEHIDGREENTAQKNLIWACRSCNTRKGAYFAREGVGRKTRQYNPSSQVRGATTLDGWLQAVLSVQGLDGGMTPAAAIRTIQATPPARRIAFAARLNPEESGPHGPILREFYHDAAAAIRKLSQLEDGEAVAALWHPEVGDIDLVWGESGKTASQGFGLAKILKWHREVTHDLQGILSRLAMDSEHPPNANTIQLTDGHYHAVIRLNWKGKPKTWLLTEFGPEGRRKNGPSAGRTIDVSGTRATGRHSSPAGWLPTSIGKKQKRNNPSPGEPEYEQYLWAVSHHQRGAHDEGGKVIHATSKATRSEYAKKIAQARKFHGTNRITGKRSDVPF